MDKTDNLWYNTAMNDISFAGKPNANIQVAEHNHTGYESAEMDAALKNVEAAMTQETYYAAMQEVYDLILQDMPIYTVCMRTRTQVAAESVMVSGIIRPGEPYRNIEYWMNVEN